MDHYNLSVEVKNKNIDKKITTDPVSQIIFILRKANQIHEQPYFVLNLNKSETERNLVKEYWKERMGSKVDIEIIKRTDPKGKIYCPVCLGNNIISKLVHESGCDCCPSCGYSKCSS